MSINISKKQKIYNLLKGIETGDPDSVKVVNEGKYIQHNPQTKEGGEGLAQLFSRLAKTNPKVEVIRLFQDGDFVFGHTIYDFSSVRVGFEIFRFEGEQVVEHWDNIQLRAGEMVGGQTEAKDHQHTESNRKLIGDFVKEVLIEKDSKRYAHYIDENTFVDNSSLMNLEKRVIDLKYKINHRLLVEGNFVLSVCEGVNHGVNSSFYDLFRIENKRIVEHWDTLEKIPPRSEWKNQNGKF